MSVELIGILAVGMALAGTILSGQRRLEARITVLEHGQANLRDRLAKLDDIPASIARLEHAQVELLDRATKPERLLEGLRDAILGRRGSSGAE